MLFSASVSVLLSFSSSDSGKSLGMVHAQVVLTTSSQDLKEKDFIEITKVKSCHIVMSCVSSKRCKLIEMLMLSEHTYLNLASFQFDKVFF